MSSRVAHLKEEKHCPGAISILCKQSTSHNSCTPPIATTFKRIRHLAIQQPYNTGPIERHSEQAHLDKNPHMREAHQSFSQATKGHLRRSHTQVTYKYGRINAYTCRCGNYIGDSGIHREKWNAHRKQLNFSLTSEVVQAIVPVMLTVTMARIMIFIESCTAGVNAVLRETLTTQSFILRDLLPRQSCTSMRPLKTLDPVR